jgi:hypothetical protein
LLLDGTHRIAAKWSIPMFKDAWFVDAYLLICIVIAIIVPLDVPIAARICFLAMRSLQFIPSEQKMLDPKWAEDDRSQVSSRRSIQSGQ